MYRVLLAALVGMLCLPALAQEDSSADKTGNMTSSGDFFVAQDGNDTWSGSYERPFATMQRALDAVSEALKVDPDQFACIALRQGTYHLEAPLRIGPEYRTNNFVSIGSYAESHQGQLQNEKVVISGGRPITGWQKNENNRWTVTLPQVVTEDWHFRQLWKDDERLPRARYPKAGGLLTLQDVGEDAKSFTLSEAISGGDLAGQDAELVVIQNWSITRVLITHSDGAHIETKDPAGWMGHDACTASAGKPAFLENAYAFLDEPGEWYLDRTTGVLTYQAAKGEDPNAHAFIAPVIDQWLVVEGKEDTPLHFSLSGIDFRHAAWPLPETGYQGIQAGHYSTSMQKPVDVLPGAVEISWARGVINDCRIEHTGASGLVLGAGCSKVKLTACDFDDIGGNGIMVGWRQHYFETLGATGDHSLASDWPSPDMVPEDNCVYYCRVSRAGAELWGCVGIFDAFSQGTEITHNHVYDLPYSGISIGFRWDPSETSQRETNVSKNHVHDVMQKLADGGCIYTLGYQPGTKLEGNLLHGVLRSAYAHGGAPNNGIFFDQGSKGYLVKDNVIYDTSGEPIRFNQTSADEMTFENNFFGVSPDAPEFPQAIADEASVAGPGASREQARLRMKKLEAPQAE